MEQVTLDVQGMSCQHCVRAVREALMSVDGVEVERVDIGSARVSYDPAKANPAALVDAVQDAGYDAQESAAP